jgi:hypothetical protein
VNESDRWPIKKPAGISSIEGWICPWLPCSARAAGALSEHPTGEAQTMNVVSYDLERRARLLAQMMSELLVELRTFTPENPITPEFCERFAKSKRLWQMRWENPWLAARANVCWSPCPRRPTKPAGYFRCTVLWTFRPKAHLWFPHHRSVDTEKRTDRSRGALLSPQASWVRCNARRIESRMLERTLLCGGTRPIRLVAASTLPLWRSTSRFSRT